MSESALKHKNRVEQFFQIHGERAPQPQFGEGLPEYRRRILAVAQHLLPPQDRELWAGVNLHAQPERALAGIEHSILDKAVARFKSNTGPLRELGETCPRTGRTTVKFFGDPANCWDQFAGVRQRVTGWTDAGRGRNSVHARAERAAAAAELACAYEALDAQRAAAGLR
jgi:hypothetical protein